jgi:hypothetical protein
VITPLKRARFLHHLPLAVAIAAWVVVGWVPFLFTSEIVRAALAVTCVGLMAFQWAIYRRIFFGSKFVLLSLIVTWFIVASLWLGLNVVRYYTYNPDDARTWAWHTAVIQIQFPLGWAGILLVPVVAVWLMFLIVGRLSSMVRSVGSRPTT